MDERIKYCIDAELRFARAKFPGSNLNFPALVEEVGELSNALLEHSNSNMPADRVFQEAIQVAVMAIRIAEEGSAEFPYKFEHSHYQVFDVNKWEKLTQCNCPTQCDCEKPPTHISNQCPVHNDDPYPSEDCPIHGE